MKIINATPHKLNVYNKDNKLITFEKSEYLARVSQITIRHYIIDNFIVNKYVFDEIVGLPEEKEGTIYIVSNMVSEANKRAQKPRRDLICPDTTPHGVIRDIENNIIGVNGFMD